MTTPPPRPDIQIPADQTALDYLKTRIRNPSASSSLDNLPLDEALEDPRLSHPAFTRADQRAALNYACDQLAGAYSANEGKQVKGKGTGIVRPTPMVVSNSSRVRVMATWRTKIEVWEEMWRGGEEARGEEFRDLIVECVVQREKVVEREIRRWGEGYVTKADEAEADDGLSV